METKRQVESLEESAGACCVSGASADPSAPRRRSARQSGRRRLPLLIVVLIAGILLGRWLGAGQQIAALRDWIQGLGSLGPLAYAAFYAAAVVAAVPGSVLSVGAGALFGARAGIVVVSVGATVGASLAFLVARYLARDAIAERFSHTESFQRLDRLTEERGAVIVALTRLIPLFPFNLLNYGFGLTRVRLGTYVFWSWLCMLPGIVVFVTGTDAVVQFLLLGRAPWTLLAVLLGGAVALIGLIRFARKKAGE